MQTFGQSVISVLALGIALAGAGCTHDGFGSPEGHFATYSVPEPKGATVHVCHAYGCRRQTKVRFTDANLAEIKVLMAKYRSKADTAEEERRAVAYAIGWIEVFVGEKIGTKSDRAGMDFAASGDPTQQDCVDEATNTTSYLTVLVNAGLIKHHTVAPPFAKENYLRGISGWTHWTAVARSKSPTNSAGRSTAGSMPMARTLRLSKPRSGTSRISRACQSQRPDAESPLLGHHVGCTVREDSTSLGG